MKALAKKPQTPGEVLRRSIANILDNTLLGLDPEGMDHRLVSVADLDELVELLANVAERHVENL